MGGALPFLRSVRKRNWQQLLSAGLTAEAVEAAEQDFLLDEGGGISVYEVTNEQERLETAVALCDISPAWPKDFDYVEFDAEDLRQIGALPPVSSLGQTNYNSVNLRHYDVLLNGEQRRQLVARIAHKLTGSSSVPRYRRKDIERAVPNCPWLSPNSQLHPHHGRS